MGAEAGWGRVEGLRGCRGGLVWGIRVREAFGKRGEIGFGFGCGDFRIFT